MLGWKYPPAQQHLISLIAPGLCHCLSFLSSSSSGLCSIPSNCCCEYNSIQKHKAWGTHSPPKLYFIWLLSVKYSANLFLSSRSCLKLRLSLPGCVLIEQFPPLLVICLLDRNPHWRVPDTFSRGEVGEHVLLKSLNLQYCDLFN